MLALLVILMALFMAMPIAASPNAIDPIMSLDTMVGAGAVVSAAAVAVEPHPAPRELVAVFVPGVIALACLVVVASINYLKIKPKDGARLSRRTLHYARDQPAAA